MLFNEIIAARYKVFRAMLTKIQLCYDYTNTENGGSKLLRNVIN